MFRLFGILDRMIFWELVRVFLLALTGLTGLFLVGGLIQQAAQLGLSPGQVVGVIPLLVPNTLPYTIPTTTLFASCVVYGRLSNDNEAVALKAAGVDLLTILRPAVLLGICTTAATAAMYYSLIPDTQTKLQAQVMKDPEEVLYNQLKRDRRFNPGNFPYAIFVRDVQGRRLLDVVIKRRKEVSPKVYNGYDMVARAREARLTVDLDAQNPTMSIDPDRWVVWAEEGVALDIEGSKPLSVPLPDMFSAKTLKSRPMALTWEELPVRIGELEARRAMIESHRDENRKLMESTPDPTARKEAAQREPHYVVMLADADRQVRTFRVEQYLRPALAGACLCFALIGCPVGIWANRSDYLSTFVICFLPTVLVYFPLLLSGTGLARDGKVPIPVGVYAADGVAAAAALLLTWRLIRR